MNKKFVAVLLDVEHQNPWVKGMEKHMQEGDLLVVSRSFDDINYLTHHHWWLAPSSIEIIGELRCRT